MNNHLRVWVPIALFWSAQSSAEYLSFNDVFPILEQNCLACHHNPGAPNGLSMETYEGLMKGSVNGPVVISGDARNSEMFKRLKGESHPRMPMNGPPFLNELETQLIANWIDSGLKQKP